LSRNRISPTEKAAIAAARRIGRSVSSIVLRLRCRHRFTCPSDG
jgi:hypothetical protein